MGREQSVCERESAAKRRAPNTFCERALLTKTHGPSSLARYRIQNHISVPMPVARFLCRGFTCGAVKPATGQGEENGGGGRSVTALSRARAPSWLAARAPRRLVRTVEGLGTVAVAVCSAGAEAEELRVPHFTLVDGQKRALHAQSAAVASVRAPGAPGAGLARVLDCRQGLERQGEGSGWATRGNLRIRFPTKLSPHFLSRMLFAAARPPPLLRAAVLRAFVPARAFAAGAERPDYYRVLSLRRDATTEQVKQAFREQGERAHSQVPRGACARPAAPFAAWGGRGRGLCASRAGGACTFRGDATQ
jgi:hypothetical protein